MENIVGYETEAVIRIPKREPAYKIGDKVYHVTPESPQGTVIDIVYFYSTDHFEYHVTFSPEVVMLSYMEHELQTHKTYQ